jgi:hypothetical protein
VDIDSASAAKSTVRIRMQDWSGIKIVPNSWNRTIDCRNIQKPDYVYKDK